MERCKPRSSQASSELSAISWWHSLRELLCILLAISIALFKIQPSSQFLINFDKSIEKFNRLFSFHFVLTARIKSPVTY